VAAAIRERIQTGQFKPGMWIRQEDLAEELGGSKIPIREALHMLAAEGLVDLRAHRGAQIAPVSIAAMEEIESLRSILESHALHLAARLRQPSDVDRAQKASDDMEQSLSRKSRENFYDANGHFHDAMFFAARSPKLMGMIQSLSTSWVPYRGIFYVSHPEHFPVLQRQHRALLGAFRSGDGARLVKLQQQHRAAAVAYLRKELVKASQ
jgi:DNA-binding GntR family transcriptional regulator